MACGAACPEDDAYADRIELRRDLLAFVEQVAASMTLRQAREWYEEAFPPDGPRLNLS